MLERCEPCFTYIHFLPDYPFVAFKGSGFLLLALQLLVILPVNSRLVTLPIITVGQQCCMGRREMKVVEGYALLAYAARVLGRD